MPEGRVYLRGVDNAKFRRQVVPGDRLRLEVTLGARRSRLARAHAVAYIDDAVVAEAELVLGVLPDEGPARQRGVRADSSAIIHPGAHIGAGTIIGPHAVVGEHVRIGKNCRIGASSVIDGNTEIGDENEIFPFASVGLIPQDLKFKGEPTRLVIGHRNVIREFVTIHRGTAGGGGLTEVGDHNVFMASAHVAHDCHVRNHTIFGNAATLGGHVTVEDYATISAFSGVHQFCRVGKHAFIGGFSVVTKDALAVREDRRQSCADLRPEHYRPGATGFLAGRRHEAAPRLPLPPALEHEPRDRTDRAGSFAENRGSRLSRRFHPDVEQRGRPSPAEQASRGSGRGIDLTGRLR